MDGLQFLFNGLFSASVYGLIALGLTLIFGVLRVGDLAQGALYAVGAYVVFWLTQFWGMPYGLAVILAIGMAALLSVFNGHVVYRRLRPLGVGATFIGAIALLLIYRNLLVLAFSWDPVEVVSPFAGQAWHAFGMSIAIHKFSVLIVASLAILALWLFLHRTRWGKGLRAVSQNEAAALTLGINAKAVSAMAFALAGAFAGGAGALLAPLWPFDPGSGTLFVLKAFAIAVIGQTKLRRVILVAGVVGLSEVLIQAYWHAEFSDLVPFVLLAGLLMVKPQLLSVEAETLSPISTTAPRPIRIPARGWQILLTVCAVVALLTLPYWLGNAFWLHLMILTGIFVILVSGLDLLTGYAGIPSLAQAGLWGIGAYTSALLALRWGWTFFPSLGGAVLVTLLAAWGIGVLGLRLRKRWTSFTFIIGIVITLLLESLTNLTKGTHGLVGVPSIELALPGLETLKLNPFRDKAAYFYLVLGMMFLVLWLKQRVVGSRMGLALVAIREDEDLAKSVGVATDRYKLRAFLLSAAFAAVAGSLYAHYLTYLHPHLFTFVQSFNLFVMNVVGGAASLLGPVLGPVALVLFSELTHSIHATLAEIVFSVLLILVLIYLPRGMVGGGRRLMKYWPRKTVPPPLSPKEEVVS